MKPIRVIREGMTLKQRREAYLIAEKHDRDFSKVKLHTYERTSGNYQVKNLKQITVSLV